MNWGGIIAGAIGGGARAAGQMAEGQIEDKRKLDMAKQLSDLDEMRQRRIAEFSSNLEREGHKARLQDTEDFAQKNFPNQLERVKQTKTAESDIELETAGKKINLETEAVKARGNDKSYLSALRNVAAAQRVPESSLATAQAALVRFELYSKKQMFEARKLMASEKPEEQERGKRMLSALVMGTRSDSDTVQAAKIYEGMAKTKRAELESTDFLTMKEGPEKEAARREIMQQAQAYEQSAAALLGNMADRRGIVDREKSPAVDLGDDPLGLRKAKPATTATATTAATAQGAAPTGMVAPKAMPPAPPPRPRLFESGSGEVAKKQSEAMRVARERVAEDAYNVLDKNNRAAVAKFQASDLFDLLSHDKQMEIYRIVNAR